MDRSAEKITNGQLVYRALTGTNGKTRFAMAATAARSGRARRLYQNRNVMPTWLGWNPSRQAVSFPALDDLELCAGFAFARGKVRHQVEKRNFKSDRNPLKYRDIPCLEAIFDFRQKTLSDLGHLR
jgi:hypothetical protein